MSYQVLARKWRPRTFQDMVGQSHVLKALANALDQGRLHHAYLFTGTRGVGKTTIARIMAKCLNCDNGVSSTPCGQCCVCVSIDEGRYVDLIEVDAASRAKVDETRELMDNVQYAPTAGRYKVYLIDEIHMFSNHSFNALLKTLEEPPPHVKFLLATTEPNKLPVTILSRCLQFSLSHLTNDQITRQIETILNEENVAYDKRSTELIARGAAGSMRDALSLLDQAIAYCGGKLKETQVRAMIGSIDSADLTGLLEYINHADPERLLDKLEYIALQNPDYDTLLTELITILQRIAVIQLLPETKNNTLKENAELVTFAKTMSREDVQLYYQIVLMGKKDIYLAPDTRSGFEMIMMRMLAFRPVTVDHEKGMPIVAQTSSSESCHETQAAPVSMSETNMVEVRTRPQSASRKEGIPQGHDWKAIIDEMALSGLAKELAGHCVLKSHTQNTIVLALPPAYEHMLRKAQKNRLDQAIKNRFGDHMQLTILIEVHENETPAETMAREELERKQAAEQSMQKDPLVKSLIDTFNGTVDKDSIQPI